MPQRLTRSVLAIIGVAVLLCACSEPVPGNGASLAKAGQAAAIQMRQNAVLSAATYAALKQAAVFDAGFAGDADDPSTQDFLKQEAQIQATLSAYGAMLDKLAAAYAALGNLAAFDAAGEFAGTADGLCGSAASLLKIMAPGTSTQPNLCRDASTGAGVVVGGVQARQEADASARIEAVLQTVIPILADPTRRDLIVMNNGRVQHQIASVAKDLFATGVYSCAPLLDALGAPLNLKSVRGVDALVARNPNLRRGCLHEVAVAAQDAAGTAGTAYDKSLDVLNALLKQHENLKAGVPLNLGTVGMIVNSLQALAARQQPQKGT